MNSVTTMSGTIATVNPRTTPAAHRTPLEQRRERERRQDQQDQGTDERPGVDHGHRRLAGDDAQQHGQHGQDGQHDQLDEHEQWSRRQQPLGRPARERGERDDVVHARGQQHEEHAHEQHVVVGHEPTQPEHHRRHHQERRQQERREDRLDEHRPRAGPGHGPPDDGACGDPGGG